MDEPENTGLPVPVKRTRAKGVVKRTHPRRMQARDRELRVITMRQAGLTYDEIAKTLGMTKSGAFLVEKRFFEHHMALVKEEAEVLRTRELARLDALQAKLWPKAMGGHRIQVPTTEVVDGKLTTVMKKAKAPPSLKAMDRILKIMQRRAALLGLDLKKTGNGHGHGAPPDPGAAPLIGSASQVLVAAGGDLNSLRAELAASRTTTPTTREYRTRELTDGDLVPES